MLFKSSPRIISKIRYDIVKESIVNNESLIVTLTTTKGGEYYMVNGKKKIQEVFLADDVILYREWRT